MIRRCDLILKQSSAFAEIRFGPCCGVLRIGDLTLPKVSAKLDDDGERRGILIAMLRESYRPLRWAPRLWITEALPAGCFHNRLLPAHKRVASERRNPFVRTSGRECRTLARTHRIGRAHPTQSV